jgi:CheY-like chemotaxis protein
MEQRHHLLFIEDDEREIATFRRLYEGDSFEVTAVCVQSPRSALPAVEEALGVRTLNLIVLDLFFSVTNDPLRGFSPDAVDDARADLGRVLRAAEELQAMFFDATLLTRTNKELLLAASDLVYQSQRMLRRWCDMLGQSPAGGIALMRALHGKYPDVPKVFYSRKAVVADVKMALEAGALDVLLKPHRSLEDVEAARIREALADYCAGKPPRWRAPLA